MKENVENINHRVEESKEYKKRNIIIVIMLLTTLLLRLKRF